MKSSAFYGQQTSPMNAGIDQGTAGEASLLASCLENNALSFAPLRMMPRERCGKRQVAIY